MFTLLTMSYPMTMRSSLLGTTVKTCLPTLTVFLYACITLVSSTVIVCPCITVECDTSSPCSQASRSLHLCSLLICIDISASTPLPSFGGSVSDLHDAAG